MNQSMDIVASHFQNYITAAEFLIKLKLKAKRTNSQIIHGDKKDSENLDEYLILQKQYKQLIQRKKRQYQQKTVANLCSTDNSQQMWSVLKSGLQPQSKEIPVSSSKLCDQFQNNAGKYDCKSFDKSFEAEAREFMERYDKGVSNVDVCDIVKDIMNSHITDEEMQNALLHLKNKKCSGLDGIPAEVLKSQTTVLSNSLCLLFNYMMDKGEFPEEWVKGLTIPIPKGGDKKNPENYRRITMLPVLGKLFETIVNIRLVFMKNALKMVDPFNGGFKKGSMTSDNIFVLSGCIDKARATNQPLYVCFVDFKRAFDSVNRQLMFYKLLQRGIDGKIVKLLRNMYKNTKTKVCVNGLLSNLITDETGVNQGGPNSPDMFVDFLCDIRNYLNEKCGVILNDNILLHLLWADDMIIVSNSASDLQNSINNLANYCSKWQLVLNVLKTKVMIFGKVPMKDRNSQFNFNGNLIEITKEYKYLGCIFQNKVNVFKEHMTTALTKASRATYQVQNYCKPLGSPPPEIAIKRFNSTVAPIIEYGSEVWSAGINTDPVDTFQVKFIKRALKLRPQTSTLAVLGEVGEYPLSIRLALRVIKYWMSLMALPHEHIARKMLVLLEEMDNIGYVTWVTRLRKILAKFELNDIINTPLSSNSYTYLKQHVLDMYETSFISSISNKDISPKLRTYRLFKINYIHEPYLHLIIPKI